MPAPSERHIAFEEALKNTLEDISSMLKEKNAKYGDSYDKTEQFLRLLRPNGCPPEKYAELIFEVRAFDKMMRAATNLIGDDEDPDRDLAGYAALKLISKARKL